MRSDTVTPMKQASDKAMKSVSARRAGKTDEEMDSDVAAEKNKRLRGHIDAIMKNTEERSQINATIKGHYDAAAEDGFDRAAMKTIIKHRTKQVSQEHRQNVNQMCLALDMPVIYRLEATN